MNSQYLDIKGGKMAYLQFGTGSELLIAIPGYGDRAVLFERLKESLGKKYTVYVLQLPLHGQSNWKATSFSKTDFAEAIQQIKTTENTQRFSLMGYSFGARVICAMLSDIHKEVKEIFLLAPDGFNSAYIRRAILLPRPIRSLLQSFLKKPSWYLALAKSLNKIGLLNKYSLRFVETHMATPKRQNRLFLFWNSIADFQYKESNVGTLLQENEIPTNLILGQKDFVIPTQEWKSWGESLLIVKVYMLEKNHRLVGKKLDDLLKEVL